MLLLFQFCYEAKNSCWSGVSKIAQRLSCKVSGLRAAYPHVRQVCTDLSGWPYTEPKCIYIAGPLNGTSKAYE